MQLSEIISMDQQYYMNTFGLRTQVAFERGNGIKLYSTDGEVYYDFLGGIATSSLGHNNKPLVNTICNQAKKVIHTSNLYYIENQALLAKMLCENSCGDKVFIANSGAEANEAAIKLARKYHYSNGNGARNEIITLANSFHGRTITTISATGQPKYQKAFAPLTGNFVYVPINDIEELKNAVNEKTGAIMLELIQGESGVHPLEESYVKEIRKICDEKDIVLIFDEIQTGVGRLGTLFGYQKFGVEPDIFTLAKGLGGGIPIGAAVAKDKFCAFLPGDHGSTFGGNPLACAAALCVLDQLINNYVLYRSQKAAEYLGEQLRLLAKEKDGISEVRGMGLMIGISFKNQMARELHKKLFDRKILTGLVGEHTIRIMPPLIVQKTDIGHLITALKEEL